MSEGLKPCPFCGGSVNKLTYKFKNSDQQVQTFTCTRCLAFVCFRGHEADPGATQAYNRRVNDGTKRI